MKTLEDPDVYALSLSEETNENAEQAVRLFIERYGTNQNLFTPPPTSRKMRNFWTTQKVLTSKGLGGP